MGNDHTLERYFYAILQLQKQFCCVRSIDVAHYLGCSKPSGSASVKQMIGQGWIEVQDDGHLSVTPAGEAYAARLMRHTEYFRDLLERAGVEASKAGREAFALSQSLSDETVTLLKSYIDQRAGALNVRRQNS